MKSKSDALIEIITDARRETMSKTSFRRVKRALKILELSPADAERILFYLDYRNYVEAGA